MRADSDWLRWPLDRRTENTEVHDAGNRILKEICIKTEKPGKTGINPTILVYGLFPVRKERDQSQLQSKLLLYWVIALRLIPMLENPPSWKRFCMVTFLVRSENRVMA